MRLSLLLLSFFILSGTSWGQVPIASNLKVSAYVDSYYTYDFSEPVNKDRPYVTQAVRHNEFNINWAFLKAAYEDDNVRASVGLQTGTYVQANYAAEPNDLTRLLYDTYAGYQISDGIWLDAGIFGGHTGYESPLSIENEVYSRALGTEYTPYYQTGLRLTAALSEQVTLTGVLLNGWQIISETNDAKSYGINLNYQINDRWEVNYGNLLGNEGNEAIGNKYRIYNHFYAKHMFSDRFHLVLSLDHGIQEEWDGSDQASFFFGTLIAGWKLDDKLDLGFRYEYVEDRDQILIATPMDRGFDSQIGSVSINYRPVEAFAVRSEFRISNSDNFIYEGEEGFYRGVAQLIFGMSFKM